MSMKKALDQTLRDIKRGVNKKVLKVPSVEQNVLDATSNEPWGPHGSLLSDIAQATRNYHEYQMIMAILWKRINDTGKNWRHVYKALTVLEYLVAHGSERVIDDIKEHAYQISTLSDFQYIDSSGRDQGNNVRRKSQSLVALVNDKERIQEVRQKAASNRDKFRSSSAVGGMYRPGSGGYGDDRYEGRYGGRDDDRNGNGRERDWGYRDDEKYGRYGDSNSREGDRYGRDSEDNYGRDSYRDDDSRGRSVDEYQYGSRSRSADRDGDRAYDEDERHSSRGSSAKADDQHDGKRLERKFSEQNLGAPPSYEDAVGVSRSPTYSERDGETPPATAAQLSPPAVGASAESSSPIANAAHSSPITDATPQPSPAQNNVIPSQNLNVQADSFDEFDPRGFVSAAPSTSHNAEMDLLGSLSDAFAPGPLAIMPAPSGPADFEVDTMKPASNPTQSAVTSENTVLNQSFDDPFGDSPFKAIPSDDLAQPHNFTPTTSFQPAVATLEHTESGASNLEFPNAFPGLTYNQANAPNTQSPPNQLLPGEQQSLQENDILAGILPPSGPYGTTTQVSFPASTGQPPAGLGFVPQSAPPATSFHHMAAQNLPGQADQLTRHNSLPFSALPSNSSSNMTSPQSDDLLGGFLPQAGASHLTTSHSTGSLALVPHQPAEKKFETKSTVWADTLNRGLVNLNISGSKINPLSDIGIDFESLNRKEKRMEKPSATPATSTVSMGKAMGSGSGIGRAGAGALRPAPNQMMGPTMGGMGMGGGPGVGMGMGNYGSVNQQQPMGMGMGGMGMGMGMGMGGTPMGMNMGMGQGVAMQPSMGQGVPMQPSMGQGVPMQPPHGLPPGSNINNYPMMGRGGYPPQQTYQYGGGYR
ncbi:clathrin interactor EPSIN 3-like [Silene latifolia]|uniref:clathrin interactor EPSIN 3-like n=1 Tax=Silene latifolia TaxID=37657 RepID=UPI003D78484B